MCKIRLNRNKNIGRVLFIVEGGRTEFSLLRRIFCDLLQYEYLEKRRHRETFFQSKNISTSKVTVINAKESHISYIANSEEYLDEQFQLLIEEYNFPVDQAAIYYLFDRDPESNVQINLLEELLDSLQDPYENAYGMRGGLLLLSYPSIESYNVSCFLPESHNLQFGTGAELKRITGNHPDIQLNKLSPQALICAAQTMLEYYKRLDLDFSLDDQGNHNKRIFNNQEALYSAKKKYKLLSLLSVVFLQLGILEFY